MAGSKCSVSCTTSPPPRGASRWRSISALMPRSRKRNEFMFFSSVLVPSSLAAGRAQRDVGVAAQRALLHVHVADAELAQRRAQQPQPLAGLLGRAQVGLGDDLHQRRAAAVEVDDARVRAVDPPARADVDQLRRVLLEVHAVDAHVAEAAAAAQRLVVLGDLVALGQVGIEVVLAVEDRARRELAAERQADHQPEVDRALRWRPAGSRAGPGRPGRCACSAARRTTARSRRTSSSRSPAARGSRGRSPARAHGRAPPARSALRHAPRSRRSRSPARARRRRRAAGSR